jgi:glycerol-3-phosphate acyltransferase PlsY
LHFYNAATMEIAFFIGCAVVAYLVGSVPTGYWLGLARGIDIRTVGSGNIGATNTFRALGKTMGVLAMAGDILKGVAAVTLLPWAAQQFGFGDEREQVVLLQIVCAVAAIAGHNWTIFLKFKGGKGVATSAGAMMALASLAFLVAFVVFALVLLIGRIVSLASILSAVAIAVFAWVWTGHGNWQAYPLSLKIFVTVMSLAILYKHRANMGRLLKGTEPKIFGKK